MKSLIKTQVLLLTLFLVLISIGCTKENLDENLETRESRSGFLKEDLSEGDIDMFSDMLSFPDIQTFENTIIDLDEQVEELDNIFIAENEGLEIEDLNDFEEISGFNWQQPLVDFENNNPGFVSLRAVLDEAENDWLENLEGDDFADNPGDHFIQDETFRTLLNSNAQVRIGDNIYILIADGWIEIYNSNLNVLSDIVNGLIDPFSDPVGENNTYQTMSPSLFQSDCDGARRNAKSVLGPIVNTMGDKKIKCVLALRNLIGFHYAYAKTIGYKKKNGIWRRYRSDLEATIYGTVVYDEDNCSEQQFALTKTGRKRKIKVLVTFPNMVSAYSNEVNSYHEGVGGLFHYNSLTW